MDYWKIYTKVQRVVFGIAASAIVLAFATHTVMAAAHHRWGVAAAMALLALCSVAVIRSAAEEMRNDDKEETPKE